jgi:hypothetical protein
MNLEGGIIAEFESCYYIGDDNYTDGHLDIDNIMCMREAIICEVNFNGFIVPS